MFAKNAPVAKNTNMELGRNPERNAFENTSISRKIELNAYQKSKNIPLQKIVFFDASENLNELAATFDPN